MLETGPHRQRPGGVVVGAGQGRPRPRGGPGGHLRLVLGGRSARRRAAPRSIWPTRWGSRCSATGGSRTTPATPTDLADLLRMGRLPEAWLAPPAVRELRELVRYRAKLVALRSRPQGPGPRRAGQGGGAGADERPVRGGRPRLLDDAPAWPGLRGAGRSRCGPASTSTTSEIAMLAGRVADALWPATSATGPSRPSPGWARCWRRCSWPRSATCTRFAGAAAAVLVGRADPPPPRVRHHRAPRRRSPSRAPGWSAGPRWRRSSGCQRGHQAGRRLPPHRRPGRHATSPSVAAARKLLTLVYYGLRDGQIRCLAAPGRRCDGSGAARRVLVFVMTPAWRRGRPFD